MKSIILVFLGGALGSVLRFSLSKWVNALHSHHFPWGTLVVNVVACFTLGVIIGLADHRQLITPPARIFWTIGFCGGFSTFSAFSHETLILFQNGFTTSLLLYVLMHLLLCFAGTFA